MTGVSLIIGLVMSAVVAADKLSGNGFCLAAT